MLKVFLLLPFLFIANVNAVVKHEIEDVEPDETEHLFFDEDGVFEVTKALQYKIPLGGTSTNDLGIGTVLSVIEEGTIANLCDESLCRKKSASLVERKMEGRKCEELSIDELSTPVCAAGSNLVVVRGQSEASSGCYCSEFSHLDNSIDKLPMSLEDLNNPSSLSSARENRKNIKRVPVDAAQFVVYGRRTGKELHRGHITADKALDPELASPAAIKSYNQFLKLVPGMKDGEYTFLPEYNGKVTKNGYVKVRVFRTLPGKAPDEVELNFYIKRENIPPLDNTNPTPDIPVAKVPWPKLKSPIPPKEEFVNRMHIIAKSFVEGVTHSESESIKTRVDRSINNSDATIFKYAEDEANDSSKKSSSQKGLCWRYHSLQTHFATGIMGPYLPARKPITNNAKDAARVLTQLKNSLGQPLFVEVKVPEIYKGKKRDALLLKQKGTSLMDTLIKDHLQDSDVVIWGNKENAGHIESYFKEATSDGGEDHAFYSDYRADLDQDDGNPDRPGGRSTNTFKTILRYNNPKIGAAKNETKEEWFNVKSIVDFIFGTDGG